MTIEQIMAWLDSKGVTLWGTFDLSQPERKLEAAIWLKTQLQELSQFSMDQFFRKYDAWETPYPTYGNNAAERWDVV